MVPSMRAYSKSGCCNRSLNRRSNTPFFAHWRKRWKTLFQLPKASGRSRHGAPVRTRHKTAYKNKRLSAAVTPQSVALPGKCGKTFCQTSSVITKRSVFIQNSP